MSTDVANEKVKHEELEKVIIDVDVEKYCQINVQLPP